jgi:LSD1 subclass zinc finger protein
MMRIVDFNCIKCGNPLQAPEKSTRVLCSVCGTTNSPGGTFSKLKGLVEKNTIPAVNPYERREPAYHKKWDKNEELDAESIFDQIMKNPPAESEQQQTKKPGLAMTALFLLMPLVMIISEMFNIPAIFIIAAAAVFFAIFIASKKKS